MLWFYLALLAAIFWTIEHALVKKISRNVKSRYLAFATTTLSAFVSIFLVFIFYDKLEFNRNFFLILIPVGLINATARMLYTKSLKHGELSKTVPLLSLSPIFTLVFAMFLIREFPPAKAIFGIVFAIVGIYILNLKKFSFKHFIQPFTNLFRNKPALLMFLVAVIYGLGGVLDKASVSSANILTYLFLINPVSFIFQGIFLFFSEKARVFSETKNIFKERFFQLLLLVAVAFTVISFQFWAVSITFSSYVIAIKRSSALFSVIAAYFIFKEKKDIRNVLVGTIITLIGTYFILFSN